MHFCGLESDEKMHRRVCDAWMANRKLPYTETDSWSMQPYSVCTDWQWLSRVSEGTFPLSYLEMPLGIKPETWANQMLCHRAATHPFSKS